MQNLITSIRKILIICGCWASRCVGKWPRLFGLYPLLISLSYLFSCHCNSKFGLSYVIHEVLQAVQSSTVLLCLIRYCIFCGYDLRTRFRNGHPRHGVAMLRFRCVVDCFVCHSRNLIAASLAISSTVDRVDGRITGTRIRDFTASVAGTSCGIESYLWTERGLSFILPNTVRAIYEAH